MIYTIKDEKGNMICSIENVDPTKSEENAFTDNLKSYLESNGPKNIIIIGILLLVATGFGVTKIKSMIQNSKIKNKIGSDSIEKLVSYALNIKKELKSEIEKCIAKNKNELISTVDVDFEDINQKDMLKYIKKNDLNNFIITTNLVIKLKSVNQDDMYETLDKIRHEFIFDLENTLKHCTLMRGKCKIVDIDSNSREEIYPENMEIHYPFDIKISNDREFINKILSNIDD